MFEITGMQRYLSGAPADVVIDFLYEYKIEKVSSISLLTFSFAVIYSNKSLTSVLSLEKVIHNLPTKKLRYQQKTHCILSINQISYI